MTTKFITKVIKDGDDLVFLFPEDFVEKLKLKDGDIFEWEIGENEVTLRLAGDIATLNQEIAE